MKYEVEISESAEKFLEKVPKKDRLRILEKIDTLVDDPMPSGSIKLHGQKTLLYRIRSGDYRVVYSIKKDVLNILVVEIGHRREVYR
ncbi:Addiction module toxin, RelE/StbE family [Neochlamydia sp. EPS4]|uniref:type II toxin-antitoxin system RelE family toxin n=1 Tax=Neochlamydia sp. EPS4 TaxID=1478175 RepID=UPI000582A9B4|nr:type II toxin-antitoxin system RelE/ParE family toxin [Neochlamydia sp. EPS4]KIC72293.1 Addiction module toxin, RelE/StbE family [Neochlamydia sp. EPS4]